MNKKIASEFAVGTILLIAFVIGGLFWIQEKKHQADEDGINIEQTAELAGEKQKSQPVDVANGDDNQSADQQENLTVGFEKDPCAGHLYEGETTLRGKYVLDSSYGDKKEWLFSVVPEDMEKLPVQIKFADGRDVNKLLKIEDAPSALVAKLKKATDENPETISIKGYYLHCEGGPVVSIAPAKLALGKYLKK
jgi:hypothetical protein